MRQFKKKVDKKEIEERITGKIEEEKIEVLEEDPEEVMMVKKKLLKKKKKLRV